MPFVDLVSKDDHVSLWYITNSPLGTIGAFDPSKPTILMLHPFMLDSSWLTMHMQDPRLDTKYNIVAFDMRSCGRSRCRSSGAHDSWVDAADLAMAHSVCAIVFIRVDNHHHHSHLADNRTHTHGIYQLLGLPPVHIFAVEGLSTNTALRIAALYVSTRTRFKRATFA
jgi:pimeloyl-ACP methyl ester carboxylesterase